MCVHVIHSGGYVPPNLYYSSYGKLPGSEELDPERHGDGMFSMKMEPQKSRKSPGAAERSSADKEKDAGGEKRKRASSPPPSRRQHAMTLQGTGYPDPSSPYDHYTGVSGPPVLSQPPASATVSQQR
ncbi:uncharacterized protein LOC144945900 [Lampetra fluviatilis]